MVTKLARIQAVQDEHTLRLERVETKVDRLETKVDDLYDRVGKGESQLEALPRAVAEMMDAPRGVSWLRVLR